MGLLLFRGELRLLFFALQVGGAAFAFDVLVQLLAHGVLKCERAMFQSDRGESSAGLVPKLAWGGGIGRDRGG